MYGFWPLSVEPDDSMSLTAEQNDLTTLTAAHDDVLTLTAEHDDVSLGAPHVETQFSALLT